MKWIVFFAMITIFHFYVYANDQPEKESNQDLRSGLVVFKIEDLIQKESIGLERASDRSFSLRWIKKNSLEKLVKLSSADAQKLEFEFAGKFIRCQYELPSSPEGCNVTLRLNMKGESQNICEKEDKKTQELKPFFKSLSQRF